MEKAVITKELEHLDRAIIAAEPWAKSYLKHTDNFAALVKLEAKALAAWRKYFSELADRAVDNYVDWYAYQQALNTKLTASRINAAQFDVDVVVRFVPDDETAFVYQIFFEPLTSAVALGAESGQLNNGVPANLTTLDVETQRIAREQLAALVGKKVTKDNNGVIVNTSPNKRIDPVTGKSYNINENTRNAIRQSIGTSLELGEPAADAAARLKRNIKNPKRAQMIAQTEIVNGYQGGLYAYGQQTGAIGKEWQSNNPNDICAANAKASPIRINERFPSGAMAPTAHPYCRCTMRLIYPESSDANMLGINDDVDTPLPPGEGLTFYHGDGANMANGNYALGDAYYVTRDPDVAKQFGKVSKVNIPITEADILKIDNDNQYLELVKNSLRAYPGENLNQALPKYVLSQGYKAVEMNPQIDELAGIAVVNQQAVKQKTIVKDQATKFVTEVTKNLEQIAQEDKARPNADINTAIENLLKSNKKEDILESIRLAQLLPRDDAVSMLRSITYNGKSVVDTYYTIGFDPTSRKVVTKLVDPTKDPLKMQPTDLLK